MAFTREDVKKHAKAQLQDDANFLTDDEVELNIDTALRTMNLDRPLTKTVDITGDGTSSYDVESQGVTRDGFSDVKKIEFPAGEIPPVFLKRDDDWLRYDDPSKTAGQQVRLLFRAIVPTSAETIRMTFERAFTVPTTGDSDLDDTAFNALVYKTVELSLFTLAARFGQTTDSTIAADAVDYGGRTNNFLFAAERFRNKYDHMTGLDQKTKASQAIGEKDIKHITLEDLFWHPSRRR